MSRLQELEQTREKINAEISFLRRDNAGTNQTCTVEKGYAGGANGLLERSPEEIINDLFTYHAVDGPETALKYEIVRDAAKHLALVIWKACPYGADRTAAIRKLREAVMTANASIALKGLSV
jgi:hypothetical protein